MLRGLRGVAVLRLVLGEDLVCLGSCIVQGRLDVGLSTSHDGANSVAEWRERIRDTGDCRREDGVLYNFSEDGLWHGLELSTVAGLVTGRYVACLGPLCRVVYQVLDERS